MYAVATLHGATLLQITERGQLERRDFGNGLWYSRRARLEACCVHTLLGFTFHGKQLS